MNHIIVGPGRMGTAIARAMQSLGNGVTAAIALHPDRPSSKQFQEKTGISVLAIRDDKDGERIAERLNLADVVWLTVPDKAVTETAQTFVNHGWLRSDQTVIHTAGSLSHLALQPALDKGASCLCMHPLQTVADPESSPGLFRGVYFTLDGSEQVIRLAEQWIQSLGAYTAVIVPEQRSAYHASAVLASNALVALAAVAAELSGLPDGLRALLPLMEGALRNLRSLGLPTALTGPVDRNDESTILKHLTALQRNPTAQSVYAALGKATADVAHSKGSLTDSQWAHFQHLFDATMGGMSK